MIHVCAVFTVGQNLHQDKNVTVIPILKVVKHMPIPEAQLSTWSNRGAAIAAQRTHQSIRTALTTSRQLQNKKFETFLQGSHRNATNVRGDSDVDLVAELQDVFVPNIDDLPEDQKSRYRSEHSDAAYGFKEFRADVLATLRGYYGADKVTPGKKAIKIAADSNRLASDVVVAIEYRYYKSYRGLSNQQFIEGIYFVDQQSGRAIVNYPSLHYENGAAKNAEVRTEGQFKPVARVLKNARSCMVDRGIIARDAAPSYFIQCLLYNVPDDKYSGNLQEMYCNVVNWLQNASLERFICQNGVIRLFGDTPEQWNIRSAEAFIKGLVTLWNNW